MSQNFSFSQVCAFLICSFRAVQIPTPTLPLVKVYTQKSRLSHPKRTRLCVASAPVLARALSATGPRASWSESKENEAWDGGANCRPTPCYAVKRQVESVFSGAVSCKIRQKALLKITSERIAS